MDLAPLPPFPHLLSPPLFPSSSLPAYKPSPPSTVDDGSDAPLPLLPPPPSPMTLSLPPPPPSPLPLRLMSRSWLPMASRSACPAWVAARPRASANSRRTYRRCWTATRSVKHQLSHAYPPVRVAPERPLYNPPLTSSTLSSPKPLHGGLPEIFTPPHPSKPSPSPSHPPLSAAATKHPAWQPSSAPPSLPPSALLQ